MIDKKTEDKLEGKSEEVSKEKEENTGNSFLIWTGALVGLLIIGILIGVYQSNQIVKADDLELYTYNSFDFVKQGNLWKTTLYKHSFTNETNANVQEIPFYANYDPRSVENISLNGNVISLVNGTDKLVLTYDPKFGQDISLSGIEIGKILVSFYNWDSEKIKAGVNVIGDNSGFPYYDCNNATEDVKVINYKFGNETSITQMGNCFNVVAKESNDIVKASDLIMYRLLGIIQ